MFKKTLSFIFAVVVLLVSAACTSSDNSASGSKSSPAQQNLAEADKLTVAVGIVPLAAFVEAVGGELVNVVTMVPPGNNPETFQPSMTQMMALSDSSAYFSLNLPTEMASILPKLLDFNKSIELVDLANAVASYYPMLPSAHDHNEHEEGYAEEEGNAQMHEEYDHHLWLSPRRAVVMVQTIADTLCNLDEANSKTYQANAQSYIAQLKALDTELTDKFSQLENRDFIIYHASYAYFADDYDLHMVSVETEGKQAVATDLQAVISLARERGIKTVLYQQEFDSSQARIIADEIGGSVLEVAPLSKDYMGALRSIAGALTGE